MTLDVLVLPSPLLPAAAYTPLRDCLEEAGLRCDVAALADPTRPHDVLEWWTAAAVAADVGTLVAHSNAGYFAPSVRAAASSDARIVFLDAALPPEAGETRLAPAAFRARLGELADAHGSLPPWSRWWPEEDLRRTVPEHLVEWIDRSCPRLPLAYFDAAIEPPGGWCHGHNAYLAFGDTYADELAFAQACGWSTARLDDAGHLHFLRTPRDVAAAVGVLLGLEPVEDAEG
ncbi:hypothetical protein [Nocardioides sp. SYSU DS0663]|uniref:hypothetical protein n=1 Tax=Nocardioides sp. SYSU DS0663 TaxID=3416445 RepID=UPI003F4C4986